MSLVTLVIGAVAAVGVVLLFWLVLRQGDEGDSEDGFRIIPPDVSPARYMLAETGKYEIRPLSAFEEAKATSDAYVIMEGESGEQIYLTCPMRLVRCTEETLRTLLEEFHRIAFGDVDRGFGLFYERHRVGDPIPGGVGGGLATDDLWVHPDFVHLEMEDNIRGVIAGERDVYPLFDPPLETILSRAGPEETDPLAFRWSVVATLILAGFWVVWKREAPLQGAVSLFCGVPDPETPSEEFSLYAATVLRGGDVEQAASDLAELRAEEFLGPSDSGNWYVVFTNHLDEEIPQSVSEAAAEADIPVITSESLQRWAREVKEGLTALVILERLTANFSA